MTFHHRQPYPDYLRREDRFVREILWQHAVTPRPLNNPLYLFRNRSMVGLIIVFVVQIIALIYLKPYITQLLQTGLFWQSRLGIGLVGVVFPGLLILAYEIVNPIIAWNIGIRKGRSANAIITKITERHNSIFIRGIRGKCEIWLDGNWIECTFRAYTGERNTWTETVDVHSRIWVLLHPTKNIVLVTYGV
jgi:hypothetical protein